MWEFTANAVQTINPGESAIFTATNQTGVRRFVQHRDETGNFLISGWMPYNTCFCKNASYLVSFGANIAVPATETVGPISVALMLDGSTLPASTMIVTPNAVEQYFNVSREITVDIFRNCCETFSVRNTSTIPILMQNANLIIAR